MYRQVRLFICPLVVVALSGCTQAPRSWYLRATVKEPERVELREGRDGVAVDVGANDAKVKLLEDGTFVYDGGYPLTKGTTFESVRDPRIETVNAPREIPELAQGRTGAWRKNDEGEPFIGLPLEVPPEHRSDGGKRPLELQANLTLDNLESLEAVGDRKSPIVTLIGGLVVGGLGAWWYSTIEDSTWAKVGAVSTMLVGATTSIDAAVWYSQPTTQVVPIPLDEAGPRKRSKPAKSRARERDDDRPRDDAGAADDDSAAEPERPRDRNSFRPRSR